MVAPEFDPEEYATLKPGVEGIQAVKDETFARWGRIDPKNDPDTKCGLCGRRRADHHECRACRGSIEHHELRGTTEAKCWRARARMAIIRARSVRWEDLTDVDREAIGRYPDPWAPELGEVAEA